MARISIHDGKSTPAQLLTNGIGFLEATVGDVFEEINGAFTVDLTVPIGSRHADAVVFDAIIKATTPHGPDYFRLDQPSQDLYYITVKCWHISNDMSGQTILGGGISNKTGVEALPAIFAYCPTETRFSGTSDILAVSSLTIAQQSLLSLFMNTSGNCFLNRWGGEVERNKFAFNIKSNIGVDRGYRIAYGRNLTGVSIRPTGEEYINRIYPKCLQTDPTTGKDIDLFLPEQYIDSTKPNIYSGLTRSKVYKCEGVKVGAVDSETGLIPYPDLGSAYAKMREVVAELYANGIDEPHFTMDITHQNLKDTEEYKPFKDLMVSDIQLGDTIHIDIGTMSLARRMSAYHYDALGEKFTKITIGDKNVNIAQVLYQQGAKMALMEQLAPNGVIELSKLGDSILNDGKIKADLIDVINLIVQRIGNDATDPAFWATIGETTVDAQTYTGILGFLKEFSESNPAFKLCARGSEGSIAFALGKMFVWAFQDSGSFGITDTASSQTIMSHSTAGTSGCFALYNKAGKSILNSNSLATNDYTLLQNPSGTNSLGVDATGVYKKINGVITYL